MSRSFTILLFLLLTADCIEPYNFRIENNLPGLVIEAQISNVSYIETKDYPSDGRYFNVKLSYTSDVININNERASYAVVTLLDDQESSWQYIEEPIGSGIYLLKDDYFKADLRRKYKLSIQLANGNNYESEYVQMPIETPPEMGDIDFEETEHQTYRIEAGESVIRYADGVNISICLNEIRQKGSSIFYRWTFDPTWVFTAPLGHSSDPRTYKCWISSKSFLKDYVMEKDYAGGYKKELLFMETSLNDRIYDDMSILITQQAMTKEYFNFWEEMYVQAHKGGLFDSPASNLKTNFRSTNSNSSVFGYFGVVHEQAKRWYFSRNDLSYSIPDIVRENCMVPFQDIGPECFYCLSYPFGNSSNVKPDWWR